MVTGTLLDSHSHQRLLPAYYSDNYVSLLPGETVHISVSVPQAAAQEVSLPFADVTCRSIR
jgi:mannosylglycoprotein endo-beta-mannosidase